MKCFTKNKKTLFALWLSCLAFLFALFTNACNDSMKQGDMPVNAPLREKLQWLRNSAKSNTQYTIELNGNETLNPQVLSFHGKKNITIRLQGKGGERIVSLTGFGSLFTIESGVTLILDSNIILQGYSENNSPLINITNTGTLVMNHGAKIIGNSAATRQYSYGGGVFVNTNGTFTMNGGEISGNCATSTNYSNYSYSVSGGGVHVSSNGTFTMNGGLISGNKVVTTERSFFEDYGYARGGGVYVAAYGTFTMKGGEISGNSAISEGYNAFGGGVYVSSNGSFTKSSGTIYGFTEGNEKSNVANYYGYGSRGHSVYADSWPEKLRDTTAEPTDPIDTTTGFGLSESGYPPFINVFIAAVNIPAWRVGTAVSLASPSVAVAPGVSITGQGWQISDNGNSNWAIFAPPPIANMSYNRKSLRYYVATNDGQTVYSNVIMINVLSENGREITIEMLDSYGDGWNYAAVRININGIDLSPNATISDGYGPVYYRFFVEPNEVVKLYWIRGNFDNECTFAIYYSDAPPVPVLTTSPTWMPTNTILVYRVRNSLSNIPNGQELLSFVVQ